MTRPSPARLAAALLAAALLAAGCAPAREAADWVAVREVTPSFLFAIDAADPTLATDSRGRVALTWTTRAEGGQDAWLSLSRDNGYTFSAPVRLNERAGGVRSRPESRPVAAFGPRGALAAAWSERTGAGDATSLVVRTGSHGEDPLGPATRVNDDAAWDTTGQHGFASLAFRSDGTLFVAWLEDRVMQKSARGAYWRWWHRRAALSGPPVAHQLMSASSSDGGSTWGPNRMLADSACACCRPEASAGPDGQLAIAYRRAVAGLRDPALIVAVPGPVAAPGEAVRDTLFSADGWRMEGCPAQGPAIAWAEEGGGMYAWYTEAGRPGVYIAPWRSGSGPAGMKRLLADSLGAARDPRLVPLGRRVLIGVVARAPGDSAREVLAVRALDDGGILTPWSLVGANVASPWLAAIDGRTALACWVEREGDRGRLRLARLTER